MSSESRDEARPVAPGAGGGASSQTEGFRSCSCCIVERRMWKVENEKGTLSPVGLMVTLIADLFPKGFLPLATCLSAAGLIYTLLIMGVIYAAGLFTMWLLIQAMDATDEYTFARLWEVLVGPRTVCCPLIVIVVSSFVYCLTMSCVAAELLSTVLPLWRDVCLLITSVLVLFPLVILKSYASLWHSSAYAACACFFVSLIMVIRACDGSYMDNGYFAMLSVPSSSYFAHSQPDVVPRLEILAALGVMSQALLVHHNTCKYYRELDSSCKKHYMECAYVGSGLAMVLYLITMFAAIFTFGTSSESVILVNYAPTDVAAILAKFGCAVALLCSFPITFATLRESTTDLFVWAFPRTKDTTSQVQVQNILAAGLLLGITIVAWLVYSPHRMVGVGGAILGSCCAFLLPCVLYYAARQRFVELRTDDKRYWLMSAAGLGVVLACSGIAGVFVLRHYYFPELTTGPRFRQTMANVGDLQYFAAMRVGGQVLKGVLDTGSIELVVISDKCGASCGGGRAYHASHSQSYKRGYLLLEVTYGSGDVVAQEAYDDVSIGPLKSWSMPFWETIQANMPLLENTDFQAIVGLGPFPPDVVLLNEKAMGDEHGHAVLLKHFGVTKFSVCLGPVPGTPGYLIWNDRANQDQADLFSRISIPNTGYWMARLEDVWLGNLYLGCRSGCGGILDSGTSLLALPTEVANTLKANFTPDCSGRTEMPSLSFRLDGVALSLPPDAFVAMVGGNFRMQQMKRNAAANLLAEEEEESKSSCEAAVLAMDMDTSLGPAWVLGMPFFRSYYTTFVQAAKFEHAAVHVAPASKSCHPQDGSRREAPAHPVDARMQRVQERRIHASGVMIPPWLRRAEARGALEEWPSNATAPRRGASRRPAAAAASS